MVRRLIGVYRILKRVPSCVMVGGELWMRLGDSVGIHSWTWSREYRAEIIGISSSTQQSGILPHKHTYLWPIQLLIDDFCLRYASQCGCTLCTIHHDASESYPGIDVGKQRDFFFYGGGGGDWKLAGFPAGFESLSMPFNQHCGAIPLRSKSYLVFKISSKIMTKHCCQVCVLSMMFCRSDSRLCAYMVSNGAIGKLEYHVVWRQANAANDIKNIIYIWFSHFALIVTHRW